MNQEANNQLKIFGKHLKALRQSKGISAVELANSCGMDKPHMSRLENGKANPKLTTLIRLSQALGISLGEFLEGLEITEEL